MGAIKKTQYEEVILDLLAVRRPDIERLPHAAPHIVEFEALRALFAQIAAYEDGPHEAQVRRARAKLVEVTSALKLALASERANPLYDAARRGAADRLHTEIYVERLGRRPAVWQRLAVARTIERRQAELAPDLALFSPDLNDLVALWLASARALDRAVSAQTHRTDTPPLTSAQTVRRAMGAVSRLRVAIRLEVAMNPEQSANLEEQILGRHDSLAKLKPRRPAPPSVAVEPSASAPEGEAVEGHVALVVAVGGGGAVDRAGVDGHRVPGRGAREPTPESVAAGALPAAVARDHQPFGHHDVERVADHL